MIELYESRTNYLKVIEDLQLNLDINSLDEDENIDIDITSDRSDPVVNTRLKFSFSENSYSLLDEDSNEMKTSKYGQEINFNGLRISVTSANLKEYRPLEVHFMNPQSMYNSFKSRMNVASLASKIHFSGMRLNYCKLYN